MKGTWVRKPKNRTTVVFVHGVLSSGETCWRHKNGTYWPELLASDEGFASTGIYEFSYKTGFFSGSYRLGDVVDSLKEYIRLDEVLNSEQIIFVCHSMGGIVARKYLVERSADLIEKSIKVGIFLIASPSLGSEYANWLAPLAKLFDHTQADALRFSQNNAWLLDLDREFMNLKENKYLHIIGKELVEDTFFVFRSLLRRQVVTPISGARYFGEPFKVPNSDHFSIAKVDGRDAIQHRLLLKFSQEVIKAYPDKRTKKGVSANETAESSRPMEIKTIKSERFEAIAEVGNAGNLLKYHIREKGDQLSFTDVFELWERDPEFVDFYVSIFKQSGYYGYVWETPAISTASIHQVFEFVIHNIPKSSSLPDQNTFAEYFNTETAPEGIVAFDNLGGDALLVVPSPYRESADYSGLAEFFSEAPISQQRELWRELGRHTKLRLSDQPMWLSVAAGGITWLHLRLDSSPKYYRFQPYTEQR